MTYFGFLAVFVALPAAVLALALARDVRAGRHLPPALRYRPAWLALLLHVIVAVAYTTPWDNYLVATRVWWYAPARVTGLVLGWVPIEEYTFFVLQTVLTGLWVIWLARRVPHPQVADPGRPPRGLRAIGLALLGAIWLGAGAILAARWAPGTYLALEIIWLAAPIVPQLAVGTTNLWAQRRLVLPALLVPMLYLSAADAVAIGAGVWTINPTQTTGIRLAGVLPIEEFVFFGLTNTLIVFGMVLFMGLHGSAIGSRRSYQRETVGSATFERENEAE
jgi:lycopene cyclase domain-containing protein